MSRADKKIPQFKDEAAERTFWENHDSSEYFDWSKAKLASFSNLKPSINKSITPGQFRMEK
jgi:hypothetical protein